MISLCMIVKNEEKYLGGCLDSVKGLADEIIIVDTGSADRTVEIAKGYGAKIYFFTWVGDFSAARNISLQHATGDWILYLDADERISSDSAEELKRITSGRADFGCNCKIINLDEHGKHPSVMLYPRLFPNDSRLRFAGKVHEQIDIALHDNNFPIIDSSIEIIHLGYSISDQEKAKKAERNLKLLNAEYEKNKSSYYAFQLGQTLGILGRKEDAEKYFIMALKDSYLKNEYAAVAYRYLAINAAERKEFDKAVSLIEESLSKDIEQPLNQMAAAKLYACLDMKAEAIAAAKKSFDVNRKFLKTGVSSAQNILLDENELCSHGLEVSITIADRELFGFFFGKINNGSSDLTAVLFNDLFSSSEINSELISIYIEQLSEVYLKPVLILIEKYNHQQTKLYLLETLAFRFKNNAEVFFQLSKCYMTAGLISKAEEALEKTVQLNPNDPTPYFYLISVYMQRSNVNKVTSTVLKMDSLFGDSPQVAPRLQILKQKLLSGI